MDLGHTPSFRQSHIGTKPLGLELITIWIWRVLHHMGSEYKTIWIWNVVRSYGHGHASNIWALEHSLMMDPPESPWLTFRLFPVVWARSSKWGHPETIGFPQFYGHVLDSPKLSAHPCWHRRRRQSQLRVRFKVLNVCNMQNRICNVWRSFGWIYTIWSLSKNFRMGLRVDIHGLGRFDLTCAGRVLPHRLWV